MGKPITIGGVKVCPGDLVMGDGDGVLIIPKANEAELMKKVDGYVEGNKYFGKIAMTCALPNAIPMTEHPALADMFRRKYESPPDYWRAYEPWWAQWKTSEYGKQVLADEKASAGLYAGGATGAATTTKGGGKRKR